MFESLYRDVRTFVHGGSVDELRRAIDRHARSVAYSTDEIARRIAGAAMIVLHEFDDGGYSEADARDELRGEIGELAPPLEPVKQPTGQSSVARSVNGDSAVWLIAPARADHVIRPPWPGHNRTSGSSEMMAAASELGPWFASSGATPATSFVCAGSTT